MNKTTDFKSSVFNVNESLNKIDTSSDQQSTNYNDFDNHEKVSSHLNDFSVSSVNDFTQNTSNYQFSERETETSTFIDLDVSTPNILDEIAIQNEASTITNEQTIITNSALTTDTTKLTTVSVDRCNF